MMQITPAEPLRGFLVVSLAGNLPGPLALARLRDLGATAIKVEPPAGDALALAAPTWYAELTEGVEIRSLDLKSQEGGREVRELLAEADVLITAIRPSSMGRLGLGDLEHTHPKLCHVEIVGYDGEDEERAGHDLTYQAEYGTLSPPDLPLVPVADVLGGERAAGDATALLLARGQNGRGGRSRVVLDTAARDAAAAVRHGLLGPGAPLGGMLPSYSIYASADGHVALGAIEPQFESRAREVLGVDGSAEDYARVFSTQTGAHWDALAREHDIPLATVRPAESAALTDGHTPTSA